MLSLMLRLKIEEVLNWMGLKSQGSMYTWCTQYYCTLVHVVAASLVGIVFALPIY